ncbi:MFS sugar transporter [Thozetella sp. PMI_491]|nr:MFS sugar transporter [Thozetella sp. PMI_491]
MGNPTDTVSQSKDGSEDLPLAEQISIAKGHAGVPDSIDEIEKTSTSKFTWLVAITASIGGLLFGYDTGIISGALVYLGDDLGHPLSSSEKELVTSLCSAGAFVGAIVAGLSADKYGRKAAIYAGCLLFTVGALIQATSYSLPQMAAGRLIVGFGVGSAAMIVPLYLAEIAPTRYRGRMIGLNNTSVTGGQVISYAIGAAFANVPNGWRYMVGLGGLPSVVLACLLRFCPESPRQLVYHGKIEEARAVISKIFKDATPEMVDDKLRTIEFSINQHRETLEALSRWAAVKEMHNNPATFRALLCACTLMVISQMSGFNTLMYYSGTLFSLVGFSNPVAVGLVVAGTNFIMTMLNALIVDPYGRRRVLISTVWGMSLGLLAVAIAFHFLPVNLETLELQASGVSTPAIVVLVSIIWFCIFYGLSVGNIAWMSTDFFPMEVRAMGTTWMTCCNWGPNIIVSSTFLTMMKSLTPSGAFGFYSAICFIGWILIIFFYPEVSGLTLEEVSEVFKHGFGVKYARQLRKARLQQLKQNVA